MKMPKISQHRNADCLLTAVYRKYMYLHVLDDDILAYSTFTWSTKDELFVRTLRVYFES